MSLEPSRIMRRALIELLVQTSKGVPGASGYRS